MLTKEQLEIAKALRLAKPGTRGQGDKRRNLTVFHDIVVSVIDAIARNSKSFDNVEDRAKFYSIACKS